jgi:hypothetical protein
MRALSISSMWRSNPCTSLWACAGVSCVAVIRFRTSKTLLVTPRLTSASKDGASKLKVTWQLSIRCTVLSSETFSSMYF